MRETVKAACENTVERIHEDFHRVLHLVMIRPLCIIFGTPHSCFVNISLRHQIFKQRRNHSPSPFLISELSTSWRLIRNLIFGWLVGTTIINSCSVTDVFAYHNGGIHRFEIQNRNPAVKSCFYIVDISTFDLTFLLVRRTCQRNSYCGSVCHSNN